jgi:hypothetical protein
MQPSKILVQKNLCFQVFENFQKLVGSAEELTKNHQFGVGSLTQFFDFVRTLVKGQNRFCEFLEPVVKGWKLVTVNLLYNHPF